MNDDRPPRLAHHRRKGTDWHAALRQMVNGEWRRSQLLLCLPFLGWRSLSPVQLEYANSQVQRTRNTMVHPGAGYYSTAGPDDGERMPSHCGIHAS